MFLQWSPLFTIEFLETIMFWPPAPKEVPQRAFLETRFVKLQLEHPTAILNPYALFELQEVAALEDHRAALFPLITR